MATDNFFTTLLVHVDDIVIASFSLEHIDLLQKFPNTKFKIKALGDLKYFLGIEAAWSNKGIYIGQRKFTLNLLADSGILGVQLVKLSMDQNLKLSKDSGKAPPDQLFIIDWLGNWCICLLRDLT